jgi:hypothetical protein
MQKSRKLGAVAAALLAVVGLGQDLRLERPRDEQQVGNSVLTWVMIVVPVYEVCALADFLVFNTVEVFSGRNPVAAAEDEAGGVRLRYAGRDYHLAPSEDGQIEVRSPGAATIRYRIAGERIVITDNAGHPLRTLALPSARAAAY